MARLSVLLPTFNEETMIHNCLESIKWADEILVVDSFSSDRTLEIAKQYGARILQREYIDSANQKNWAIPQCEHEWVLQIDADERLDPDLQSEIQEMLKAPVPGVDGYRSPFKHYILGKWVTTMGLYPEYHLRLFRRDVGRFQNIEVDAHIEVPGEVRITKGHFTHYGTLSVSQRLRSLDRYTRYESNKRFRQGRHFSWFNLIARPTAAFLYSFILKQGFRDGFRGLFISYLRTDFVFWTYAKLWEKDWQSKKRGQ